MSEPQGRALPRRGSIIRDGRNGKQGRVYDYFPMVAEEKTDVWVRPVGGGTEWKVPLEDIE